MENELETNVELCILFEIQRGYYSFLMKSTRNRDTFKKIMRENCFRNHNKSINYVTVFKKI